jgi:hypothetical protein
MGDPFVDNWWLTQRRTLPMVLATDLSNRSQQSISEGATVNLHPAQRASAARAMTGTEQ